MDTFYLLLGIAIAVFGPLLALTYLRPILLQVLGLLCPTENSNEFWWRTTLVLALTGSVFLMLLFGLDGDEFGPVEFLRRSLLLAALATFVSVAIVARRIWSQIARWTLKHPAEKTLRPDYHEAVKP